MKRKINFLGISGMLLLATIACQREDFAVPREEKQENFYEKVSLDEAKAFFEQAESRKLTQKGANFVEFVPNWNEFQQVKTELDLNYSKLPIRITHTQIYGEVLFLKKNDSIQQTLLMLKKDSVNAEGEIINGRFYLFNTKGIFIDAYKMENRTITKRLVVPWKKSREQSMTSRSCNAVFGTHVMMSRGVTSSWGVFSDCGRGGSGSNPEEQKISLDEVVVEYTPIPSFSYYWGAPSQGSSVRGNAVSASDVGAHLLVGGSGNRGKGGKSGNAPNIPTIPDEKDYRIDDKITDPKIKCLHNKLRAGNNDYIKQILDKFEGKGTEFDIVISSEDKVLYEGREINAKTTFTLGSKAIHIRISQSKAVGRSALDVARTIFHEYIHADIFRKLNTEEDKNLPEIKSFRETYDEYTKKLSKDKHHEYMAKHYVSVLSQALKKFHQDFFPDDITNYEKHMGEKISDKLYEALAWIGLKEHEVDAFNELSQKEKDEIEQYEAHASMLSKNCN